MFLNQSNFIGFFLITAGFLASIKVLRSRKRKFEKEISKGLTLYKCKFVNSITPEIFKKNPFSFDFEISPFLIKSGAKNHKNSFIRKVIYIDPFGEQKETYAKITKNWFKETKVKFNPNIEKVKI
jgi:hypothetical protein